uniref:Polynucleotide 5'-hydroxyl-kinase NOL9 n=1 Tax=Corvus moneduloides TaxID=1196302 RepID=A0A8U7NUT6_CORMO
MARRPRTARAALNGAVAAGGAPRRAGRGGASRGAALGGGGGSAVMPARRGRPRRAAARALARASRAEAAWREFGTAVLLLALTFTGKCRLRCLYGAVRLLGFAVASHHPGLPVFSPATHCALSLEALPGARPPAATLRQLRAAARAAMRSHRVQARVKLMARFSPDCAVVLLEHLDTPVTRFLLSHPPLSRLFEPQVRRRGARAEPAAAAPVSAQAVFFFWWMLPHSLSPCSLPVVEYMECDIGQTEFTPPGCVSLSSITEPVLGPPFTHQQMPRKMVYYGQTSCEQDTERYLDVVKYVFSCYKKEVPLVINTMGWVKGEGLLLLIDIIRLLAPSHIVQMDVCDWKAMPPLTPEHVHFSAGLHTKGKQQSKCKHRTLSALWGLWAEQSHTSSLTRGCSGRRVHSGILRDMSILGYLGHLQSPDIGAVLPLHSLVPYQVPFNAVALRVIHTDVAPSNIMYAVNASWVGLCCIPEEVRCQTDGPVLLTQTPVCDCLGFGIVRGVDMEKKLYHILTPVPPENLRLVNCLLLGNIAIPNCVLVGQQGIEGEIPYVTSDYNYSIMGSGKLRKKKQHLKRRELGVLSQGLFMWDLMLQEPWVLQRPWAHRCYSGAVF